MALDIFSGDNVPTLLARAREALGPEACVIQVRRRGSTFELIAASETGAAPPARTGAVTSGPDFSDFSAILAAELAAPVGPRMVSPAPPTMPVLSPLLPPKGSKLRPRVIALVGPTGAGKTTTIAKLASHPSVFGKKRVGLLGLDCYRVGAIDQLRSWGELAGAAVEVVHHEQELRRGASRLVECDVILIDTPGRGPRQLDENATLLHWLTLLQPDEVHLTLPAGQMPQVSRAQIAAFKPFGVTHLLATKVDECPDDVRLFDIATDSACPMRWWTDGQQVPADLQAAAEQLSAAAERRVQRQRTAA